MLNEYQSGNSGDLSVWINTNQIKKSDYELLLKPIFNDNKLSYQPKTLNLFKEVIEKMNDDSYGHTFLHKTLKQEVMCEDINEFKSFVNICKDKFLKSKDKYKIMDFTKTLTGIMLETPKDFWKSIIDTTCKIDEMSPQQASNFLENIAYALRRIRHL